MRCYEDCGRLRERRQRPEVGADPSRSSGFAEDQITRIEVFNQLSIEQVGVALDELPEALGAPALDVHGNEVKPRARDRLVILVWGSVQPSDVPDRCDHGLGRYVDRIKAQVGPGELDVLAMAEAASRPEDLAEDL
jgi:hypothetical protein